MVTLSKKQKVSTVRDSKQVIANRLIGKKSFVSPRSSARPETPKNSGSSFLRSLRSLSRLSSNGSSRDLDEIENTPPTTTNVRSSQHPVRSGVSSSRTTDELRGNILLHLSHGAGVINKFQRNYEEELNNDKKSSSQSWWILTNEISSNNA